MRSGKYPEDVVAAVNGKTITTGDIEQTLTERKMTIAIANKLYSPDSNSLTLKDALIQSLSNPQEELNPEQNRYLESMERMTTKDLSYNEAFNILLRQEIFFQEAMKLGHEVSMGKAKEILAESNVSTNQALREDEEAWKKYSQNIKYIDEVYKQFGFKSEEDYLNQRIDKTAQFMTISRMRNQFNKVMADKLPELDTYQISNAWNDYGEFLLDKAKVKIANPDYSVEWYGKPWGYGSLDLK